MYVVFPIPHFPSVHLLNREFFRNKLHRHTVIPGQKKTKVREPPGHVHKCSTLNTLKLKTMKKSKIQKLILVIIQGDHSPDTLKFPDISLTMRGTNVHVKQYS